MDSEWVLDSELFSTIYDFREKKLVLYKCEK